MPQINAALPEDPSSGHHCALSASAFRRYSMAQEFGRLCLMLHWLWFGCGSIAHFLQVPGDLEIVAAAMKRDRKARLAVPICPSTFEADVASLQSMPHTLLPCCGTASLLAECAAVGCWTIVNYCLLASHCMSFAFVPTQELNSRLDDPSHEPGSSQLLQS